jgi:carbonic anhydrase/acetyltransferase-like protein (isoleucine patch superfamily)
VIRGDFGPIIIGDETAVEDNVVIHTASRTTIGNRVIIGHMAMIHDATIEDEVLIGMKAMICEGTIIRKGAFIAEQSLVLKNQIVPSGTSYAGSPAKYIKTASNNHHEIFNLGVQAYIDLTRLYHRTFKRVAL